MARRTIRARRASPYLVYLVIALSLLTVAGGVGWGWMYSLKNQSDLFAFGKERLDIATGSTQDLWRVEVFDNEKLKGEGDNLLDIALKKHQLAIEYRSEIQRLTERLMGDPLSSLYGNPLRQSVSDVLKVSNDVMDQAADVLQKSYQVGAPGKGDVKVASMQASIRSLMQRIEALVQQIRADATTAKQLETQIRGLQEELATAKTEHARQTAQNEANWKSEKASLVKARDEAKAQSDQFSEELKRTIDRLIAYQRQATADREKLAREILTLQNNIQAVTEVLGTVRKVPAETGVDGRIINVAEQGGVAYGDLGKKDGILLGMPFSIFSANDVGKPDAKPKAECTIVKIMDNSSQLRIHLLQKDNPVVIGDILHNPVYDRQRRLRFVLVGKMDINGDGVDDVEQLKALIQEFGGRIDAGLTVQADYLVVGDEPPVVAPPAAGASPQERQTAEEARKRFIEYTEAKARAVSFSVPVLSLNRFMGLLGLTGQQ